MIRIKRVTVWAGRTGSCTYWSVLENGMAVLGMWKLDRITLDGRQIYERVS